MQIQHGRIASAVERWKAMSSLERAHFDSQQYQENTMYLIKCRKRENDASE